MQGDVALQQQPAAERARVHALVRRHGRNATAFQTLAPGFRYFFHGEACVAYVDTVRAWVGAGAPIGEPAALAGAARAFVQAAQRAGRRCCFIAAEEKLKEQWGAGLCSLGIGAQPIYDPQSWPQSLSGNRNLKEQLRRARAKGVRVRQITAEQLRSDDLRAQVMALIERWLASRDLAPMDFLLRVDPFSFADDRCFFVAERAGQLVGFAGAIPVPLRRGWFVEDLLRDPNAPNGTSELLVDGVMRWAAQSGCDWVTLGVAPLAGEVAPPLRWLRRAGGLLYDFRGLLNYKSKFQPQAWSNSYLLYPVGQSAAWSVVDTLAAFTRGGFLRFAARSLLRGSRAALRVFAALLIPWTALLVLAPTRHWFATPWIKWGWVAFDLCVVFGLLGLLRRTTTPLLTALAVAVSVDAVLTLTQAYLWNWRTALGAFEHLVVVVACAAPFTAALALWGARRRLQRAWASAAQF
jgi:phosphatidylglycerol lysyltransferase